MCLWPLEKCKPQINGNRRKKMTAIYRIGTTNYDSLQLALNSGRSGSISVSDGGAAIQSAITSGAFTTNAGRISKITNNDGVAVTLSIGDLAINKAALIKLSSASVDVTGSVAAIGSNITSLDAVYSKIRSIKGATADAADDATNINISYNDYKASKNIRTITKLINETDLNGATAGGTGDKVNITGFSGSSQALSALIADGKVAKISVNDTIANLTQNASLIMASAKIELAGAGVGVSVTDTFRNLNTVAAKNLLGTVLATKMNTDTDSIKISMSVGDLTTQTIADLNAGSAGSDMANIRASMDLVISGTAKDISKNAKALTDAVDSGSLISANISKVKINDGTSAKPATLNITDAQYQAFGSMIAASGASNTGRYNYVLSDVTAARVGTSSTLVQGNALVKSFSVKDTATAIAATIVASLSDKVTSMTITGASANDVTTSGASGINTQFQLLSRVAQAKLKVEVSDTAALLTAGTSLADVSGKSFVKSIKATTSAIADLTSTTNTNGINIVKDKRITSIDVTASSQTDANAYLNANTRPTKVTFLPV